MSDTGVIDFRAVFDSTPSPLLLIDLDYTIRDMNGAYLAAVGRNRSDILGQSLFEAFPGPVEGEEMLRRSFKRVVDTGQIDVVPVIRYPVSTATGVEFSRRCWSASHVPIRSEGAIRYILQNTEDVTAVQNATQSGGGGADHLGSGILGRAERVQALNVSLLQESAQLRNIFMRAPSFMCFLRGPDHVIELANTAFSDLIGRRELIGRRFRDAVPESAGQVYLDLLDEVYRSGEPFVGKQMRAEFERAPGGGVEEVFISFVFQPILGEDGAVRAIFVDGNDVSSHVRAEKSQALLVRELHHRVRNTLATVQGVMNSTARTAETIEDYQWAFSGRISSLARTHALLTEEIQQFVSFPNLLRQEIGAYADGASDRVILEGPDLELPSQLAVPLGMTIHEMTTNAFRHGALSVESGRVTVTWSVKPAKDKRILTCRWVESGGPTVKEPTRHGFGSMVLARVLTQQISATVKASYPEEGFRLVAEIPLDIERS